MEHTSKLMHYFNWTKRCSSPPAKDDKCSIFLTAHNSELQTPPIKSAVHYKDNCSAENCLTRGLT